MPKPKFSASNKGVAGRKPVIGDDALNYRRAKRLFGVKFANGKYPEYARKIDKTVDMVKTNTVKNYAVILKETRTEIADVVAKYGKDNTLSYSDMQRYNRLKTLNGKVEDIVRVHQKDTFTEVNEAFKTSAMVGFEGTTVPLAAIVGITPPKITGKMVQDILNKPYSGITPEERAILRTRDLGVRIRSKIATTLTQEGTIADYNKGIKEVVQKDLVKTIRFIEDTAHSIGQEGVNRGFGSLKVEGIRVTKTWVTAGDDRVRDAHILLDGQTVEGDEVFEIPSGEWAGYTTEGPGLFGEPALDYNCRCWLVGGVQEIE